MFRAFLLYILVKLYNQVTQVQHANRGVGTWVVLTKYVFEYFELFLANLAFKFPKEY
jgi:hypothetical protein